MFVEIITPEKKVFEGEASSVMVPGTQGQFQMLEQHAAILSTLLNGTVKIKTTQGEQSFEVKSGVVEMQNNKVIILAESA